MSWGLLLTIVLQAIVVVIVGCVLAVLTSSTYRSVTKSQKGKHE